MRMGDLSHALHMKSMELFATKVLQAVREGIAHSA
jgi:hypothetical protein